MEWKEPHRREMAQQIIRTLLALSESDGNLNESELLYIVQVGDRIGIDIEEIRSIASGQYRQEFLIPTSEEERMSLLFYLMLLMKVDEEIADSEEKMIYEVGFKLGFNELMIRDMLVVLKTNLHKKLPPDALLKEVKKYLNWFDVRIQQTSVKQKLGIRENFACKIINPPDDYFPLLTELPAGITFDRHVDADLDFIHIFTNSREELVEMIPMLKQAIRKNGMIWVSWYKKKSGKISEINEDIIRQLAIENGLVDVKVCAVDEYWSGLKLVIPLKYR